MYDMYVHTGYVEKEKVLLLFFFFSFFCFFWLNQFKLGNYTNNPLSIRSENPSLFSLSVSHYDDDDDDDDIQQSFSYPFVCMYNTCTIYTYNTYMFLSTDFLARLGGQPYVQSMYKTYRALALRNSSESHCRVWDVSYLGAQAAASSPFSSRKVIGTERGGSGNRTPPYLLFIINEVQRFLSLQL